MRFLYFDCFAGISGHMLLAALCDLGIDQNIITGLPHRMKMDDLDAVLITRECHALRGLELQFPNANGTGQRTLSDVTRIIDAADLSDPVKKAAGRTYRLLALAEARVHNSTPELVKFHEVGYDQAIAGVTGFFAAMEALGWPKAYSSSLVLGNGLTHAAHGVIPLPGPAVMEILKGKPVRFIDLEGETVTPTGAALLAGFADFGPCPEMIVSAVGYGVGAKQSLDRPNMVRVIMGEGRE
ncbi:MAG: LarC family nickel insertion protein [candidate division Zixibacteria bacterium]|nr:LarC family nickel insertion protein [candidate division Zixibacteria bacterium]